MKILLNLLGLSAAALASVTAVCAQAPTVDTLKQVLNQKLQKLRPDGSTERNVLFQEVRAGNASGGDYPFQVTALVRDYGPGYPANRFYGETCVGRMDKRVFRMSRDDFGQWQVEGAMTITHGPDLQCKPNPSAGVSSIPLASLQGVPAPAGTPPPAPAPPAGQGSSALATGEYACYGSGGRLLIGLGFKVVSNGKYTDLDHKSTGAFTVQGGTITFHGGHLDGQTGRNLRGNKFVLGSMVSCEPFH
ncbi:MAG TPA: hypothetical protein VIX89_08340 [Bryobacteraceae bacterium]